MKTIITIMDVAAFIIAVTALIISIGNLKRSRRK